MYNPAVRVANFLCILSSKKQRYLFGENAFRVRGYFNLSKIGLVMIRVHENEGSHVISQYMPAYGLLHTAYRGCEYIPSSGGSIQVKNYIICMK
jgi:hypothetical protein